MNAFAHKIFQDVNNIRRPIVVPSKSHIGLFLLAEWVFLCTAQVISVRQLAIAGAIGVTAFA